MRAKILKFPENMQYSINARHARNVNSISDHLPEEIRARAIHGPVHGSWKNRSAISIQRLV